jgi:GNAT superfamily N-acetyltransferase
VDELAPAPGIVWRLRPGRAADVPFWRAGRPRPPLEVALAAPRLARYVEGWGRPGDAATLAEDLNQMPIGAAWYRHFRPDAPGHGFIDAAIPEISLAVRANWRGRGIGTALLTALLTIARAEGVAALSLSVERDSDSRR